MTSINSKMGLKAAGTRAMMKLPTDRALRNRITSAVCPNCQRTGARLSKTQPDSLWCSCCYHTWRMEEDTTMRPDDPVKPLTDPPRADPARTDPPPPDDDDRDNDLDDDDDPETKDPRR